MKMSKEILEFVINVICRHLSDKFHALFICPFYSQVRNKYLKQCNQNKPVLVFRLFVLSDNCNNDDLSKLAEHVRVLMSSL